MLMSGALIVKLGILQLYGVDLSLRRVLRWTSPATIDFDNSHRQAANTNELRFNKETKTIKLCQGAYLVEFNECVSVLLDSGAMDAGYKGALGVLLDIKNLPRIVFYENVKLGQIVMY
ncbi:dUTPase-like protein [Trichoderma sp. SZMC 28013]